MTFGQSFTLISTILFTLSVPLTFMIKEPNDTKKQKQLINGEAEPDDDNFRVIK